MPSLPAQVRGTVQSQVRGTLQPQVKGAVQSEVRGTLHPQDKAAHQPEHEGTVSDAFAPELQDATMHQDLSRGRVPVFSLDNNAESIAREKKRMREAIEEYERPAKRPHWDTTTSDEED